MRQAIIIKNNGTRYDENSNLLEYWRTLSNMHLPHHCPVEGCLNKPEVGTLTQKENAKDENWYVIPLCKLHNSESGNELRLSVLSSDILDPFNVSKLDNLMNAKDSKP